MEKMQTDLQQLLGTGEAKCGWLGKRASAGKLAAFTAGRIVEVGMDGKSALMQLRDHPAISSTGLQVFRKLAAAAADERMVEVYVFPEGAAYVVNLLRIVGGPGHKYFRSLVTKAKKLFRFGSLRVAMLTALRIVNAGSERKITSVLKDAEKDVTTK